jgi:hypothetical protein
MSTRQIVSTLAALLGLAAASSTALAQEGAYFYAWQPHTEATLSPADQQLLREILDNVATREYRLKPGDSLDRIVGRLFLVQTKQAAAFRIYREAVERLNPLAAWRAGDTITVPVGPQYSGMFLPEHLKQVGEQAFRQLSHYAVRWGESPEFGAKTQELITRQWQWLVDNPGQKSRSAIVGELESLGVVGPVQEENPFRPAWWAQAQLIPLRKPVPGAIAASVSITAAPAVACPGPCTACAERVGPNGPPAAAVRVLLADTGLDPHIPAAYPYRLYPPPNLPGVDTAPALADDSPDQHGTYIYHELVKARAGILDPQSVYVAKVSTQNRFDLKATFEAIQKMAVLDANPRNLIIANVSAAGYISQPGANWKPGDPVPQVPALGQGVLMIAAAGNDGASIDDRRHIYGQFGGPETPVLLVGALARDNATLASYSNRSPDRVHLLVQGDCMCGIPQRSLSGTSQAAPIVTAAAALLAADNSRWDESDIKWRLISTADRDRPEWTAASLGGRLNLGRAREPRIQILPKQGESTLTDTLQMDDAWQAEWARFSVAWRQNDDFNWSGAFLRLADAQPSADRTCWRAIRYNRDMTDVSFCVPNSAALYPVGAPSIRADQIRDIIFPLPRDRRFCGGAMRLGTSCP